MFFLIPLMNPISNLLIDAYVDLYGNLSSMGCNFTQNIPYFKELLVK